jgi:protein Mpv17
MAMAWEAHRRRLVNRLTTTYLFGRVPLTHALVMVLQFALLAKLGARYNAYYDRRPIATMMVTNAILNGLADTVAQTITIVRERTQSSAPRPKHETLPHYSKDDAIPLGRLARGAGVVVNEKEVFPGGNPPHSFDFERLSRFAAYGFVVAPLQYRWFGLLSRVFPMAKGQPALGQALKRVVMDQLVYAPFGLALFFSVMTVAEGGGRRAVQNKMRDMYLPTLKANYILWPAVQMVNFRLMPMQFQLPFVSTIGIAWTAYLSLTNATEDEAEHARGGKPTARFRQA